MKPQWMGRGGFASVALILSACTQFLPSRASADGDAIAIVNGRPLDRERLVRLLIEAHGVEALQQLVVLDLAEQEARRRGIRITDADVEAEFRASLQRLIPEDAPDAESVSAAQRREALERILEERGLSMPEYRLAMRRNAYLRRIVEPDLKIEENTLREEFSRTYDEKVEVRHVQLKAGDFDRVQTALDQINRGTEFAEVVREFSENPASRANGGLLPPFSFKDEATPAVLREAAFALQPGEVSRAAILAGKFFHILKVERRIPPEGVKFDQVRDRLHERVKQRASLKRMNEMVEELYDAAQLRILDLDLRRNFEAFSAQRKQNAGPALP